MVDDIQESKRAREKYAIYNDYYGQLMNSRMGCMLLKFNFPLNSIVPGYKYPYNLYIDATK